MTGKDIPQKHEGKISIIEDFYAMKLGGWHETQGKDGYWKMSKTGYFPIRIPQKLIKQYPSEFGEKIPQSPDLYQKIAEREEQDRKLSGLTENIEAEQHLSPLGVQISATPTTTAQKQEATQPGTYIQPVEFILHDTARRALESVWVMEGLHKVSREKRHELPFAHVGLDAKGNPQAVEKFGGDKSEILLSLADLAVYFLIDCYMKFQKADETIVSLNVEKILTYNAYCQEKKNRIELEEILLFKSLLKI